jgi:hypothetical protein
MRTVGKVAVPPDEVGEVRTGVAAYVIEVAHSVTNTRSSPPAHNLYQKVGCSVIQKNPERRRGECVLLAGTESGDVEAGCGHRRGVARARSARAAAWRGLRVNKENRVFQ